MIEHVTISDLGVIERAELDLHPGFTVVTGETGAGKTMVVTAFGLLLGARAEATAVRAGAKKAAVDAELQISTDHPVWDRVAEAGVIWDEEEEASSSRPLLLGRALSAAGRSRASVSGRPAPISVLGEIGAQLVTVHGQSDQLRLKSAVAQRAALDRYAGSEFSQKAEEYRQLWNTWRQLHQELEEITTHERQRRREEEQLQQALTAIDEVDPQPGEDTALKSESLKLENVETLREAARDAQQALSGPEIDSATEITSAVELVSRAEAALLPVIEQDAELKQLAEQTSEISALLNDAASQLGIYAAALDESGPERLAQVQQRRAEIDRLLRLYGPDVEAVLEWAEQSRRRLAELQTDSDRIEQLTAELSEQEKDLWVRAKELRTLRGQAAVRLQEAVGGELAALAMPQARLVVHLEEMTELGPYGADTVSLLLAPHRGAAPLPLAKGASGGELSRVMLALEVVLAEQESSAAFIFDEVDSGVGGEAAVQIGQRLAALAQHSQVIVVTHLPQVAAFADQHIHVRKMSSNDEGGVTSSDVQALSHQERVEELARMLAGHQDSKSAKAHAAELLNAAASSQG